MDLNRLDSTIHNDYTPDHFLSDTYNAVNFFGLENMEIKLLVMTGVDSFHTVAKHDILKKNLFAVLE